MRVRGFSRATPELPLRRCVHRAFVVVLDEILKDGREEVEFLIEDFFKAEINELIDERTAEGIALGCVSNENTQFIKQRHLSASSRLH